MIKCKEKADVYIPKTLQNKRNKANEIVGVVKEAILLINKEAKDKQPKEEKSKEIIERPPDILKPPAKEIIRQSSEKIIQRLEPISERTPLYSDSRRERIQKHSMKMTSIFQRAFN